MILIYIIITVFFIVLSFFFSGTEAGYLSLNTHKLKQESEKGNNTSKSILKTSDNANIFLSVCLLGNNLSNIGATNILTILLISIFGNTGSMYASFILIPIILTFGEILPKIIFKNNSNFLIKSTYPFFTVFYYIFFPFVFIINIVIDFILKIIHVNTKDKIKYTKDDLINLFNHSINKGFFNDEDIFFLSTASSIRKLKAIEIMTPLTDLTLINKKDKYNKIISKFNKSKSNFIPVYKKRADNLVGYVNIVNIFNYKKKMKSINEFIIMTDFIPETTPADRIYDIFKKTNNSLLFVVDEYGGCSGVISVENIIESIFGLKYINKSSNSFIKKINKKTFEIDTAFDIDDFNKYFNIKIKKIGFETIGGYINYIFKHIPKKNEKKITDNIKYTILDSSKKAVNKILVEFQNNHIK